MRNLFPHGYIVAALLLSYSIIRIVTAPSASGHEYYIFAQIPDAKYGLIGAILLTTTFLFIQGIGIRNNQYWKRGIILLFLSIVIFLSVPLFRGYFLTGSFGADYLNHLGRIYDIADTGHVSNNWYPANHVTLFVAASILNIDPISFIDRGWQPFFYLLYISGIALFIRSLTIPKYRRHGTILGICFASALFFAGSAFTVNPNTQTLWLIPILLLVLFTNGRRTGVLVAILAIFFVLAHPTTSIIVFLILVVFGIEALISRKESFKRYFLYSGMLIIPYIFWITGFQVTWPYTRILGFLGFIERGTEGAGEGAVGGALDASLEVVIYRFVEQYLAVGLFAGAGLIASVIILYFYFNESQSTTRYTSIVAQYWASVGVGLFLLFILPLFGTSFYRQVRYLLLICAIIIPLGILVLLMREKKVGQIGTYLMVMALIALLISSSILLMTTYSVNNHTSEQAYTGGSWVVHHHDQEISIHTYSFMEKIMASELGHDYAHEKYSGEGFVWLGHDRPFDDRKPSITELAMNHEGYILTNIRELDWHLRFHESQHEERRHYTEDEYGKLSKVINISKIYDNPESNVWINN